MYSLITTIISWKTVVNLHDFYSLNLRKILLRGLGWSSRTVSESNERTNEQINVLLVFFLFFSGRPFLVELINPRVTYLSEQFFTDLQREINSSSEDVAIRDLQQVTK